MRVMRVLRHYRGVPAAARGSAVAIGNFDGLHRGHRAVIGEAGVIAHGAGVPWAALTFEPHPRRFFRPETPPFRLTPFRTKMWRLAEMGVDVAVVLRFDARLATMEAEAFVSRVLVGGLAVRHVVVGPDFAFGHGRRGDAALLHRLAHKLGFGFTEITAVGEGAQRLASTGIRALVREGRVAEAIAALGEPFVIEGRVARGAGRGRALGFPTANLSLDGRLHPGPGIFAVRAAIAGEGRWHPGIAYVGRRPTFAGERLMLETMLFDFDGDLYGRRLCVAFHERIREDRTFASAEALAAQMTADCREARRILARAAPALVNPPAA